MIRQKLDPEFYSDFHQDGEEDDFVNEQEDYTQPQECQQSTDS